MWKEIVRIFSILGKEILPKKGKNEGNLDFQMWKQGIQNPSRESVVKWLCQDTFFLLNCSSKNGLKSYGTFITFCSAAERVQGPQGKKAIPSSALVFCHLYLLFSAGMCRLGAWGCDALKCFQICKKFDQRAAVLKESWQQHLLRPCFLVTIVDQLVKTPSPPTKGVSAHHCFSAPKASILEKSTYIVRNLLSVRCQQV